MKIIRGWKKISNQGGYVNDTTGQTLTISKKEFTQKFHVVLYAGQETSKEEGKTISPDYGSESKAETFAIDWMEKHPSGTA